MSSLVGVVGASPAASHTSRSTNGVTQILRRSKSSSKAGQRSNSTETGAAAEHLRAGGDTSRGPADQPVGPFAGEHQPIVVMRYTGWPSSAIGERFATLVADADVEFTVANRADHGRIPQRRVRSGRIGRGEGPQVRVLVGCRADARKVRGRGRQRGERSARSRVRRLPGIGRRRLSHSRCSTVCSRRSSR